jgi:hypothetical protein
VQEVIADAVDEGNPVYDEVNPAEDPPAEQDMPAEEDEEDLPAVDLPAVEPLVADIPLASNTRSFPQRRIPIRYALTDNPDRGSRNLPEPKHLLIKLPEPFQLFGCVWVAQKGEEVYFDFYARNDQDDARKGRKVGDPWRWIKVKANGEIAMGISRPYTKSMADGELVRDYGIGAFKITVPLVLGAGAGEPVAEDQPAPRRPFS